MRSSRNNKSGLQSVESSCSCAMGLRHVWTGADWATIYRLSACHAPFASFRRHNRYCPAMTPSKGGPSRQGCYGSLPAVPRVSTDLTLLLISSTSIIPTPPARPWGVSLPARTTHADTRQPRTEHLYIGHRCTVRLARPPTDHFSHRTDHFSR